ncbi:MAG TPA: glycosyltransferase family 2 protein [Parasulfuritortus sp.]
MNATLSVVIITKNEAGRLRPTLESVRFADEIVVLDSGSDDGTADLAREYTDKVFVDPVWPGFGEQKNRALAHATGDWVLSLDADERVSAALQREIRSVIEGGDKPVYALPRLSSFCGRDIHHSGWWPDYVPRLFKRGAASFSPDLVHERLLFEGEAGRLKNPLSHESFRTLDEVLDKINRYSTAGAEQALAKGKRGGLAKALFRGGWAFIRSYLLRAGFLDGREGLMLAISTAEGVYYRYLKLGYLAEMARRGSGRE